VQRYFARRLFAVVPVMLLVTIAVFAMTHVTPGDPIAYMLEEDASPEAIAALRHELGFDQPAPVQYIRWLGRVLQGDLGRSVRTGRPVAEAIFARLGTTAELAALTVIVSLGIGLPAGVVAAVRRNSSLDALSTVIALLGVSLPHFFLGLILILVFGVRLRWLPASGYVPPVDDLWLNLRSMILPALTLGTAEAAIVARMTRSSLLEVLRQDYILTARAKGLGIGVVVVRHALRNALIPVVTVVGLQAGALLGGAIITESIFALPGVGRLIVSAVLAHDFPLVQGVVLFLSLTFIFTNLAVDMLYAYLDPRIRYA
jgi:peptide/nickel transport system permease protein